MQLRKLGIEWGLINGGGGVGGGWYIQELQSSADQNTSWIYSLFQVSKRRQKTKSF